MELIKDKVENTVRININDDPPLKGCRPSVDLLFGSAADVYGRNIIAVILTGMGTDGTSGAESLKSKGARIVAQDEDSSVVWGMPGSVINAGLADNVFPLKEIPQAIVIMMKKQGAAVI
jgi:two-component system chemotaxis response regulator CheB